MTVKELKELLNTLDDNLEIYKEKTSAQFTRVEEVNSALETNVIESDSPFDFEEVEFKKLKQLTEKNKKKVLVFK